MMTFLESPVVLVLSFLVVGTGSAILTAYVVQRREWAKLKAAVQSMELRYRPLFDNAPVGYHELDARPFGLRQLCFLLIFLRQRTGAEPIP